MTGADFIQAMLASRNGAELTGKIGKSDGITFTFTDGAKIKVSRAHVRSLTPEQASDYIARCTS